MDKHLLITEYMENKKSVLKISKAYGISPTKLYGLLKDYGIAARSSKDAIGNKISDEKLKELYNAGHSTIKIAKLYNMSTSTVNIRLDKLGVVRRSLNQTSRKHNEITLAVLHDMYINKGLSVPDIAERLKVDNAIIYNRFKEFGIETRNHSEAMILKRKNVDGDLLIKEYVDNRKPATEIAKSLGVHFKTIYDRLKELGIPLRSHMDYGGRTSQKEIEITQFLDSIGVGYRTSVRNLIENYELDIVIDEYKMAIEFNGLYWHSIEKVDKNYHVNKTKACQGIGYRLIHIWSDLWESKQNIYKSIILSSISKSNKLHGRKCAVRKITYGDCSAFMQETHLQGAMPASYYLGAYTNNELVSVMSFTNKSGEWEISRFCNKLNVVIHGVANKLFKYFINDVNPTKVISYCDASTFTGTVYKQLGMKLIDLTQPDFIWFKGEEVLSRHQCQMHRLKKSGYTSGSVDQIMSDRGFTKLYKCGHYKFVLHKLTMV